jgi:predicted XRE-type DNA-binding protein
VSSFPPRRRKDDNDKSICGQGPTRNLWLQLGFPDAEQHFLKAELVLRLDKAITSLGLTQRAAARRTGATQPELSKILGGKFSEVSLERLIRFFTALGCHIEIKVGAGQEDKAGDVTIKDVRRSAA